MIGTPSQQTLFYPECLKSVGHENREGGWGGRDDVGRSRKKGRKGRSRCRHLLSYPAEPARLLLGLTLWRRRWDLVLWEYSCNWDLSLRMGLCLSSLWLCRKQNQSSSPFLGDPSMYSPSFPFLIPVCFINGFSTPHGPLTQGLAYTPHGLLREYLVLFLMRPAAVFPPPHLVGLRILPNPHKEP